MSFAADGDRAFAATPAGVFVASGDGAWTRSDVPDAAIPGRAIAPGSRPGRVYLLGARGIHASSDHGRTFTRIGSRDLPDAAGRALFVLSGSSEALFAVFEGRIWASLDQGNTWSSRDPAQARGRIETLASDLETGGRLWAASSDRLHVSDDLGATWRTWGAPIEGSPTIRAMAVARAGALVVLATHRGLLRSDDGGKRWPPVQGDLPIRLEAGLLVRDPHDAQTMYSGFSLVPYAEIRRRAEEGTNLLARLDPDQPCRRRRVPAAAADRRLVWRPLAGACLS